VSVPRYYQLAILEAVIGLDPERALEALAQVRWMLKECVKARRGGDPEAERRQVGDDASAVAQSAARSMIVEPGRRSASSAAPRASRRPSWDGTPARARRRKAGETGAEGTYRSL
jgi:hypothetical protein